MLLQEAKNEQSHATPAHAISGAEDQHKTIKVLIPYDGSESAEMALYDLRRAGLPQALDALVAVTNVWLPLSPFEITRAVSSRRMRVLAAGASSFVPALRDHEEQRVLSLEAERRISSMFPLGTVKAQAMRDTATVANEILVKAREWGAELIVVGSNTSPLPHVTDYAGPALKVALEAHCSVRIVRTSRRKDDSSIRIIIGLDGSTSAADVVHAVAGRVWPQGSEAHLVGVRKNFPRDPRQDSEMALALEQSADDLRATGLTVSTAIREGQPQAVLLREARELSADCIFINAHGLSHELGNSCQCGLSELSEILALEAHCSVEIVRAQDPTYQCLKPAA